MRTMTTINWIRKQFRDTKGELKATAHTGRRGSWSFTIETKRGGVPVLDAVNASDGRCVIQEHRSLKAAKNAALELLHPSEAMGWTGETGQIQYRAQWDSLVFVVFATAADTLAFQWRDTETSYRSDAYPVSGIREARELAAAVLRDRHPSEGPADERQAADGPHETLAAALSAALTTAGISFTGAQLARAAGAMLLRG